MAEFTRDIKQLQKTASQQPSFAPPSQSLGQDVVNLIGTGLDFYSKNQAQSELDAIAQRQAQKAKAIDTGALELRQYTLEAKSQKTPTAFLAGENAILKKYGPELASSIISQRNKLIGKTSYDVMSESEKAAKVQQDDRFTLESKAITSANAAGISLDADVVGNMEATELRRYVMKGEELTARRTLRINRLAEENSLATNQKQREEAQSSAWLDISSEDLVGNLSLAMSARVRAVGGLNETTAPELVKQFTENKATIRNRVYSQYVRQAKDMGVYVNQADINLAIENAEGAVDSMISMLKNKDQLEAIQNNADVLFQGGLMKSLGSANPLEREAAFNILGSNYAKQPILMKGFDTQVKYASQAINGQLDISNTKTMRDNVKTLSPIDPAKVADKFGYVDKFFENYLDGTPTQQKAVVKSGAYEDIVAEVAKEGSIIIAPESKQLQADRLYKTTSKVLAATVQGINIKQSYKEMGSSGSSLYQTDTSTGYELDISNNQFKLVPAFKNAQPDASVKKFNSLVQNQIKAFEELGMSKDYIEDFKRDVATSLSISPTERM